MIHVSFAKIKSVHAESVVTSKMLLVTDMYWVTKICSALQASIVLGLLHLAFSVFFSKVRLNESIVTMSFEYLALHELAVQCN
jgi:hypothetical protein